MRPNLKRIGQRRPRRGTSERPVTSALRSRGAEAPPRNRPPAVEATREDLSGPDEALRRGREAGGPNDHAHYTCSCGYVFEADVSTTVSCPHCGGQQAW